MIYRPSGHATMATPAVKCPCGACAKARLTIQQIFDVLNIYGWLLDSYVVDFFEEQLWENLPSTWKRVLQTVTPDEFGDWLTGDISRTRVWPLSLLALRQVARALQLNRDHENNESILRCSGRRATECPSRLLISENDDEIARDVRAALKKYNNHFLKHIKIKKRHEIQQMAQICADCARDSNAKCIVDVGAGMGHLARFLAFRYGLYVACIEQDVTLSQQAKKWDKELLTSLSKRLPDLPMQLPRHVSAKLESADCNETGTIREIQEIFMNDFHLTSEEGSGFGIVGLHPCGDLAAMLLRLYASRREARFICIVGCCHMKLTLGNSTGALSGYPLSECLSSSINRKLSYTALEVACHAIESYCDKLKTGNYEELIVHAYRAALETILIKYDKRLRRCQVRNVKVTKSMTFEEYCMAATADFQVHVRPKEIDIRNAQVKLHLSEWRRVVIFGALRTMLAPLVETVVLLDRFLYLSENHLFPALKPIFDAKLSPRNFLLFSVKDTELHT